MLGLEEIMNRKCVLITGSTGIGKSLIEKYAQNNFNVVMTYVNHEEEAKKLENEIKDKYQIDTLCIKCDISKEEDIINLKKDVINKFKTIDVLINNAGIAIDTTFDMKTKEIFMKTLEVNLVGTFLMSKHFGDLMFENKSGNIVNISSTNGIDSYYEFSIDYDASKAGVINLSHNLANHYAPYVRVNTVCPGWVNTPMNKELSNEFKNKEIDKILLNRFAEPYEIAELIYFITSDNASYLNDSVIKMTSPRCCPLVALFGPPTLRSACALAAVRLA